MKVHLKQGFWVLASPNIEPGETKINGYNSERRIDGRRFKTVVQESFSIKERIIFNERHSIQDGRHFLYLSPSFQLAFERLRKHIVCWPSLDFLWEVNIDTDKSLRVISLQVDVTFLVWDFGFHLELHRKAGAEAVAEARKAVETEKKVYNKALHWFVNQPTPNPAVLNKLVKK